MVGVVHHIGRGFHKPTIGRGEVHVGKQRVVEVLAVEVGLHGVGGGGMGNFSSKFKINQLFLFVVEAKLHLVGKVGLVAHLSVDAVLPSAHCTAVLQMNGEPDGPDGGAEADAPRKGEVGLDVDEPYGLTEQAVNLPAEVDFIAGVGSVGRREHRSL